MSEWKYRVGVSNKVASERKYKVHVSNKVASERKYEVDVSSNVANVSNVSKNMLSFIQAFLLFHNY